MLVFQGVVFCTWPLSLKHWRLAHIVTCRWSQQRQQVAGIDDWSITRVAAAVAPTFPRSTREPKGTLWTLKPQISILSRQAAYCQGQRKTLLELQQTSKRLFSKRPLEILKWWCGTSTLPETNIETNIASENGWLEMLVSFWDGRFSGNPLWFYHA